MHHGTDPRTPHNSWTQRHNQAGNYLFLDGRAWTFSPQALINRADYFWFDKDDANMPDPY